MDEDGWDAVKPYIADQKVNYRVVLGDDTVGNLYGGIESLPTTFLIDQDGRVASVHIGLVSKKDYDHRDRAPDRGPEIDELIRGPR